jgi:hypothetical protein
MPGPVALSFERSPAAWPSLVRALLSRRPALLAPGQTIPALEARLAPQVAEPGRLEAYRALCGFDPDEQLPITYPHLLAGSMHLALLSSGAFPLRVLGLVHLRNRIEAARPIGQGEPLELRCRVGGHRETERGQDFDLITEARAGGELAWVETSTMLARRRAAAPARPALAAVAPRAATEGAGSCSFRLGADLGRRYAGLSGDYNPIHLSAASARLFGFRRAIIHGMWSLARVAAELQPRFGAGPLVLEAAFKLPVLLPGRVTLRDWPRERGFGFALLDETGERPHATGSLVGG